MNECAEVLRLLPELVDGELAPEQSAGLNGHLKSCAECRAALARFTKIDRDLTAWGRQVANGNPASSGAREQLAARMRPAAVPGLAVRWMPAAAAAIAIALALSSVAPPPKPPAAGREPARFVEIPYLPPLDPQENATIVRMNIRVATLIAVGYRVTGDPDTIVPADVLVGEDGRAHAVRVLSGIDWNGTGD
jgi:hypothetical protein